MSFGGGGGGGSGVNAHWHNSQTTGTTIQFNGGPETVIEALV